MKQHNRWLAVFLATTLAFSPIAEAKRAGGGKSVGMSRQSSSQQSQPQRIQPTPIQPSNNTQQKSSTGSNVGKMVAAGVAGAAVGALAANAMADNNGTNTVSDATATDTQAKTEDNSSSFGWLWWLIIIGLAFAAFRFFSRKKVATAGANPYAPNQGAPINANTRINTGSHDNTNIFGQAVGGQATAQPNFGAYTNNGNTLPDGSEPAAFLRIARQRFNHIQAMNSASNIEEIRRYLTPDVYNAMYQDIMANRDEDVAEFSNLNAMVIESTTENGQYIVSVRFTGTVTEDLHSQPTPFTEIWHFVKPVGSNEDWLVAGIQQD